MLTSSQHIFESVKHSLERLQLDYVDVLQCTALSCKLTRLTNERLGHRFDIDTPIEETVSLFLFPLQLR